MNDALLAALAFATATLTAITGIGGGIILVASMPGLLPAPAIVPVHAMVQLFSNASRALFGWRFISPEFLLAFAAGACIGGPLAAALLRHVNLDYTPLMIAAYILFSVWGPKLKFSIPQRIEFVTIGLLQTGLSMVVAATGPLGQAALMRRGLGRDALVVTAAAMMSFTHGVKIIMFMLLGFTFSDYWQSIAAMSAGVILGTLLGTRIRYRIPEKKFKTGLKWLLTLLALRMIYITLT